MFRFIRNTLRELFPKTRLKLNHGGRLISATAERATSEERILIQAGVARSTEDARWLLAQHGTKRAKDVLKVVERHKRQRSFNERAKSFIQRLEGHDTRDVYGDPHGDQQIRYEYKYRRRDD